MTWAAVILAGGTGARLDGADKATLEHDGRTLLERALDAVTGASETVVVADPTPTSRPVRFVREQPVGGGPLAALRAGVEALASAPDRPDLPDVVVVLAVDMPNVTRETVARLVTAAEDSGSAWLVSGDARRQLAGALSPAVVLAVADPDGRPFRTLWQDDGAAEVPAYGREAADVDTWADLARLRDPPSVHETPRVIS